MDCYPCFFIQTLKTARMATSDEQRIHQILKEVSAALPKIPFNVTPAEIGRDVYAMISRLTGVEDPYKKVKESCIHQALSLL